MKSMIKRICRYFAICIYCGYSGNDWKDDGYCPNPQCKELN